jgi:hypothetical protein
VNDDPPSNSVLWINNNIYNNKPFKMELLVSDENVALMRSDDVDDYKLVNNEVRKYDNSKSLFLNNYLEPNKNILLNIYYPSLNINNNSKIYSEFNYDLDIDGFEKKIEMLDDLYNYHLISLVSEIYQKTVIINLTDLSQNTGLKMRKISELNDFFSNRAPIKNYEFQYLNKQIKFSERLLELLMISIAQQSIINGNMMLNRIKYNLDPNNQVSDALIKNTKGILNSNFYLRANFANHCINYKLRLPVISKYNDFKDFENDYKNILEQNYNVDFTNNSIKIYNINCPIPLAESVYYQEKYFTQIHADLINQKNKILDLLIDMKIAKHSLDMEDISPELNIIYKLLMLEKIKSN